MGHIIEPEGVDFVIDSRQLTKEEEIADDLNPNFMFSTTWTDLLSKIAKGEIDANFYARQELCNRGLDLNGNWIGFKAAKAEHKM